jgi:hypothetical protein
MTYGGATYDRAAALVQTGDDGYALAGSTDSYGAGSSDFWLVKTDSNGNAQWNKTYGGIDDEWAYALVQTVDGGYVLAGYTYSFGAGDSDFWLVKTDADGNEQWNRTYGGIKSDYASSVVQTSDGGYAIAGSSYSFGAGNWDFWLVKTDADGSALWNRTYDGAGLDSWPSVVQTSDGGYAIAGTTENFAVSYSDFWFVRTDSSGNALWNRTYGGTEYEYASSVVQTSDGGYAIAGYAEVHGPGGYDFWLVKIGVESGLTWTISTADTITLYRGATDPYWNFVRVRIWKPR